MQKLIVVILITFFSCKTVPFVIPERVNLDIPIESIYQKVNFEKKENGYFLSDIETEKLTDNINKMKKYIKLLKAYLIFYSDPSAD